MERRAEIERIREAQQQSWMEVRCNLQFSGLCSFLKFECLQERQLAKDREQVLRTSPPATDDSEGALMRAHLPACEYIIAITVFESTVLDKLTKRISDRLRSELKQELVRLITISLF